MKPEYSEILQDSSALDSMESVASLLHQKLAFWWTGFYLVQGDELVLGPYQGPPACERIKFGKGVCGTAWKERRTVIVPDVELFPGHIACSSESRSEIVVPLWRRGHIEAVLDIDSRNLNNFDEDDRDALELVCAILSANIRPEIARYVEDSIIPRYDSFDKGHQRDHVRYVISQALMLCCHYDVDPEMVFIAAAFHDTGLCEDRATHHIVSARIIRKDQFLPRWFSAGQIETIADAAQDHRASLSYEPRTIYGKIIAEADRQIIPEVVIRRTVQFGWKNYPELDREQSWKRTYEHLLEKYSESGYLKLWIPESSNAGRLAELREIIRDKTRLREIFDKIYDEKDCTVHTDVRSAR